MKYYFFIIPILIGIVAGSFLVLYQPQNTDSKILTVSNLIENGSPVLGELDAPITILEWGDYQCTYCYKFHQDTLGVINEDFIKSGKVKIVFKDFPLNGPDSKLAAEASYCADDQEKYWQYHDELYNNWGGENTGWITENVLQGFARDVGLNMDEFSQCLENSEYRQKVLDNEQFAREIGINATPSFLIFNDSELYRIIGAQPFDKFEQAFEELGNS